MTLRQTRLPLTSREIPTAQFADRASWLMHAQWLRQHLRVSLGLLPQGPRCPLRAKLWGTWDNGTVRCRKVAFESLPGFLVTGNLYEPLTAGRAGAGKIKRYPGVLCPHGHWPDGRLHENDPLGSIALRCMNLAALGAVVFSYDMVGYNDSAQLPHDSSFDDPAWGLTLLSLQTYNSIRALDFLQELPQVNGDRIGVTGASGGGTQSFILAAVDERVTVSGPAVMVSAGFHGGCMCENAPLLRLEGNNVEIAALHAPKPQWLGACLGDWTRHMGIRELPDLRAIYQLFGKADRVQEHMVNMLHNYGVELREHMYGFFARHLLHQRQAPVRLPEKPLLRPPLRDRMVWWGQAAPTPLSTTEIQELWRQRLQAALQPALRNRTSARRQLKPLLGHLVGLSPAALATATTAPLRHVQVELAAGVLQVDWARRMPRDPDAGAKFFSCYRRTPTMHAALELLAVLEAAPAPLTLRCAPGAGALGRYVAAVSDKVRQLESAGGTKAEGVLDLPNLAALGGMTALQLCGPR